MMLTFSLAACNEEDAPQTSLTRNDAPQNATQPRRVEAKAQSGFSQVGGEWPDLELTRQLPEPDMQIAFVLERMTPKGKELTIEFRELVTLDHMSAYAEQLKNKGFTFDVESSAEAESRESPRIASLSYKAKNRAGYAVHFHCLGKCVIDLKSPGS
ncbi:MAG: hypothetical protein LBS89_00800 [Zoogloeaceae bacterium]|nr:hypothetical protein [Zoogloeaceae bacterium]